MGHANSTRRIAAEKMARQQSCLATPPHRGGVARPPTPPVPRSTPAAKASSTYTLPFTCDLIRNDRLTPSQALEAHARRTIEEANWDEYLLATMRDAVREPYSFTPSQDIPIEEFDVTVSSSVAHEMDPAGFPFTIYRGTLTWTSASCPLERLQEELNWRIGDRMSMYELDGDGWHIFIEPGKVTVV